MKRIAYSASDLEHWVSAATSLLGILAVLCASLLWPGTSGAPLAVASIGASAVLLFAVPHGALSQPWPLFGGHLLSALIGVSCYRSLGDGALSASIAVSLSIFAMYALRCLHPPGGATALFAVLGGPSAHALGYGYALHPVLLNASVLFAAAVALNAPFPWRRYPHHWIPLSLFQAPSPDIHASTPEKAMIPHSSLVYALSQLDTFIDVDEDDLQRIYALAMEDAHHHHPPARRP